MRIGNRDAGRYIVAHLAMVGLAAALVALTFFPPVEAGKSSPAASMWASVPGRGGSGWTFVAVIIVFNLAVNIGTTLAVCLRRVVERESFLPAISSGIVAAFLLGLYVFFANKGVPLQGPSGYASQPTHFATGTTVALWVAITSFVLALVVLIHSGRVRRRAGSARSQALVG